LVVISNKLDTNVGYLHVTHGAGYTKEKRFRRHPLHWKSGLGGKKLNIMNGEINELEKQKSHIVTSKQHGKQTRHGRKSDT